MSAATEIQALRTELAKTQKQLDELARALNAFFDLSRDQYSVWREAKRIAASDAPAPANDVTVGKGLPAAAVRTELNGIGM